MKIALINDTHCGVRNSSEIFIKHQEDFYSKIFFPYLDEHNIKHVIHAGDYFDSRKSAASIKAIHENRKHFVEPLKARDIKMDIILGNHDVYHKNTNEVSSVKEYFANEKFEIIENAKDKRYDGKLICLVPWINSENFEYTMQVVNESKAELCIGHFEFQGFPMYRGGMECNSPIALSPTLFKKFKQVLSGHFHTSSLKGNVYYLGSQMEFTWGDYGDQKYFHILDTDTMEVVAVPNPHTLHKQIEYEGEQNYNLENYENKIIRVIVKENSDYEKYEKFLNDLNKIAYSVTVNPLPVTLTVNSDDLTIENVSDTKTIVESFVDTLETDLDKKTLIYILNELYDKANNM